MFFARGADWPGCAPMRSVEFARFFTFLPAFFVRLGFDESNIALLATVVGGNKTELGEVGAGRVAPRRHSASDAPRGNATEISA